MFSNLVRKSREVIQKSTMRKNHEFYQRRKEEVTAINVSVELQEKFQETINALWRIVEKDMGKTRMHVFHEIVMTFLRTETALNHHLRIKHPDYKKH